MGVYLSKPVTKKYIENGELSGELRWSSCSMQGWRTDQEDAICVSTKEEDDFALFCVFDGHGGAEISRWVSTRIAEHLVHDEKFKEKNYEAALINTFKSLDSQIAEPEMLKELQKLKDSIDDESFEIEGGEDEPKGGDGDGPLTEEQIIKKRAREFLQSDEGMSMITEALTGKKVDCDEEETDTESELDDNDATDKALPVPEDEKKEDAEDENAKEDEEPSLKKKKLVEETNGNQKEESGSASNENGVEDEEESSSSGEEESDGEEEDSDENEPGAPGMMSCEGKPGFDSGTTALVCLFVKATKKLFVANAGDCRAVLSMRKQNEVEVQDLSVDHKPEDPMEKKRIVAAGSTISEDGRVNGIVNLSRAIGDHTHKLNKEIAWDAQAITAFPDVEVVEIDPAKHRFLLLACDGIWNSLSSQETMQSIQSLGDDSSNEDRLKQLFDKCLAPSLEDGDGTGADNMSAILVEFFEN